MMGYPLPLVIGIAMVAGGCVLGFIAYGQMHAAHHREKRHHSPSH